MNTRHIYKMCKSNKVFGGVYAKDRCLNKQNCTLSVRIPHGPQVNTSLLWTTHRNHVSSLTRMVLRALRLFLMMPYKVSQPMCAVTTVSSMFLHATGASPQSCFALLCELGDSTHDRYLCVCEMCVVFWNFLQ